MSDIVLRRANVVKRVDSEDKAQALEAKGFLREGKEAPVKAPAVDTSKLEAELASTKEELAVALKENASLKTELAGTKEQLDAALKKNKDAEKNKAAEKK